MEKKAKLKQLLARLTSLEGSLPIDDTKVFLDRVMKEESEWLASSSKERPSIKYLGELNSRLEKFKKDNNLTPIISAVEKLQTDLKTSQETSTKEFERVSKTQEDKYTELSNLIKGNRENLEKMTAQGISKLLERVDSLQSELSSSNQESTKKGQSLDQVISELGKKVDSALTELTKYSEEKGSLSKSIDTRFKDNTDLINKTTKTIDELRDDIMRRLQGRGGSANQQINVNSSVMSNKYADINFVAGSNVTLSKSDDDTNKRVNITINSTGGGPGGNGVVTSVLAGTGMVVDSTNPATPIVILGNTSVVAGTYGSDSQVARITINEQGRITAASIVGITFPASGSGITRSISNVSTDTNAGSAALTDYVYFATAGIRLTLPTAVGNNNLYTVKNRSNSSVLVVSGEGIDDSPSALMPSNYESLSFISNSSIWGVV